MLEQTPKSSDLSEQSQKLQVDFCTKSSMGAHMVDDSEIDPSKVCSGLFALITARLEDAHEMAVKGQATKVGSQDMGDLVADLRSMLDEVKVQIDAIELMNNS